MNGLLLLGHRIWLILFFVPWALLLTVLAVLGVFILRWLVGSKTAARVIVPRWSRGLAWALPLRVSVSGEQNIDSQQAYVVVANHLSMLDILAIFGWSGLDLRWVLKHELRHIPLIGWGCSILGYVFVDRSNREAAIRAINKATGKLEAGEGMMFFPEGTRSKNGELLAFKMGAFKTAAKQKMPVLPISIKGTYSLMPSGALLPKPGRASIQIHPPITTDETGINTSTIANQAYRTIASALDKA